MRIIWKAEWRDPGDASYTFIAVTDEHPTNGSFDTSTIEGVSWIRPIQIGARASMVESADPYLPVVTFTFVGIAKRMARVQMRRMIGDRELSITEENLALSTFRRLFQRGAADCVIGAELRSGVEFPGDVAKSLRCD